MLVNHYINKCCSPSPRLDALFQIAMGTFIVSFAGHALVTSAAGARALRALTPADSDARRRLFVVAYFAAIAAAVTLAAVLTLPEIGREGADLVALLKSDTVWVDAVGRLRAVVGEGPMEALERAVVLATESDLSRAAADRGHVSVFDSVLGGGVVVFCFSACRHPSKFSSTHHIK
jgi:hypothetical protein